MLLIAAGCSNDDSKKIDHTSTHIKILEKQHSEDYEEMWVVASYENELEEFENIDIYIEEPMVWNLIEINREYFVNIIAEEGEKATLGQISYPGDKNSVR